MTGIIVIIVREIYMTIYMTIVKSTHIVLLLNVKSTNKNPQDIVCHFSTNTIYRKKVKCKGTDINRLL